MKIIDIRVLRGPNYWSNYREKLIAMKLDLQEYENITTDLLPGFIQHLIQLMPSLFEHRCSVGVEGGFLQRVQVGTLLGHVVEHVALELQCLAGMYCSFGRARVSNKSSIYNIIFSYEIENAGIYAAETAVKIVQCLAQGKTYPSLKDDIQKLKTINYEEGFGPSTKAIIDAAQKRDIPYKQVFSDSIVVFGHGIHQKKICAALTSHTSAISVDIVSDKELTKQMLHSFHIPVPKGVVIKGMRDLKEAIEKIKFPLVIKPSNGNHGKCVTTNILQMEDAEFAYQEAKKISDNVIVEEFIEGEDYRFLVINYKVVAVAKRKPASIIGDGKSTIENLIEKVNADPRRGQDHENVLTKITIDRSMIKLLQKSNLSLNSVLPHGQEIYLKCTANLSTGGTAEDVTNLIHPYNKFIAERVAHITHLDVCGIDIVSKDITQPLSHNNGAVIEVNAAPGLRMHLMSAEESIGKKDNNVASHIIDLLYPANAKSRIPITAVTGTNGKTTTVRLLAHFAKQAGFNVGFTSTDGIYINDHMIYKGDCSGPKSAATVLRDPTVDFAVFECARGGIIESGLGFDKCNISIVTNVSEDHLGLGGIETIEELARVKSVVPQATFPDGYAILNADDDLVFDMRKELDCKIALFSMQSTSERIEQHCATGGLAAYLEEDKIIVIKRSVKKVIANITDIPLSFQGKAAFMIQNVLPAILAGIINNYDISNLSTWLHSFVPSAQQTPGRMNLFNFEHFKVLVDYGHNVAAFVELKKYLQQINCNRKIGIIGVPGDRRNIDIESIGYHSAQIFDEIIIRHDKNGRGRTNQEITALIKEGIMQYNADHEITIISDEQQAIEYAINNAKIDNLIAYFPEDIAKALAYLEQVKSQNSIEGNLL